MEQKSAKIIYMIEDQNLLWLFDDSLNVIECRAFQLQDFRAFLRSGIRIVPPGVLKFSEVEPQPC